MLKFLTCAIYDLKKSQTEDFHTYCGFDLRFLIPTLIACSWELFVINFIVVLLSVIKVMAVSSIIFNNIRKDYVKG
jgi:hypothetical protein